MVSALREQGSVSRESANFEFPGPPSPAASTPGSFFRMMSRVLSGPPAQQVAEPLTSHIRRLGQCPVGGLGVLRTIEKSGLTGRGGAAFPTARKWSAIADQDHGGAVVVVNAHEGEPSSRKDRTLITVRPHLVLDGALLAAESIRAREIIVYTSDAYTEARESLRVAIAERVALGRSAIPITVVTAPPRYVSGEASAAVNSINGGPATPVRIRPRVRGVHGRPTLVQNAETLAHVALIARAGQEWFREVGTDESPGTALVTVSGAVGFPGLVVEAPMGCTVADLVHAAGGCSDRPQAILMGGFSGMWHRAQDVWNKPMGTTDARRIGLSLDGGILVVLPEKSCCLAEASGILLYLAMQSAGNCGPCVHGTAAIGETMYRIVHGDGTAADRMRLRELVETVGGRGGCSHPDGAIKQLVSAVTTFGPHMQEHISYGRCDRMATPSYLPNRGWL